MKEKIYPLLFGGDINVYSVARAFHEAYGLRSTCFGKYLSGPAYRSSIIDYHACENNEDADAYVKNVVTFANSHQDGKVFVIGCGDAYVKLAAENKHLFPKNCIVAGINAELLNTLINKEKFYEMCDQYGLDHPATFIYHKEMGHDFTLPFTGPFICKPSNSVTYWEHPFEGNDKVFLLQTMEELYDVLDRCYAAGYPDTMIIQDCIPGDDSYMRVLTNYSDKNGQVKMMCLGHVLLEEHTPHGLGNHAVIMTEKNEEICMKLKKFLEDIHYVGFSNFDMKYDERDGKLKLFEINCRQGRSNYYVTGAGFNIARYLVEDYIEDKELPFEICENESLWQVVPSDVARDFIVSSYHDKMRQLEKEGKMTNSLVYKGEKNIFHRLWDWYDLKRQRKNYETYAVKKS